MSERAVRPIGFFEKVFAFWGLGVMVGSLGLTYGADVPFLEASKWSVIVSTALAALYLVSALLQRVTSRGAMRANAALSEREIRRLERRARELMRRHAGTLARKRAASERVDDYGATDDESWAREQDYFIQRVILDGLKGEARESVLARDYLIAEWREEIEKAADEGDDHRAKSGWFRITFRPGMSGPEYERFCAQRLRRGGWRVRNWRDTGDQGVDLVGARGRRVVAIQCKRYRSRVGNSAVQEIVAGQAIVGDATHAAVCASNGFTRAAKELALANGVLLLHHDDLSRLDDLIDAEEALRRG